MNELINLLGIENIYGGITELLGGLTTATTAVSTSGSTAGTCNTCNTCRKACRPRPTCCPTRCCNPCSCATTLPAEVASVSDVTYDVTVSSHVDVPMKIVNLCPGKAGSNCRRHCHCCCCSHHHHTGGGIPGCWAR